MQKLETALNDTCVTPRQPVPGTTSSWLIQPLPRGGPGLRRKFGGEGGIRTGTGVSPYNALANEWFSTPSLVFKDLGSDAKLLSRTQNLSFGSYCAPLCAPLCAPNCPEN